MPAGLNPKFDANLTELPAARRLRATGEFFMHILGTGLVWGFAGNDPVFELIGSVSIFALIASWFAHALLTKQYKIRIDVISISLAALVLISLIQLVPLPLSVVKTIAPTAAELHLTLRPETSELLPDELTETPRPTTLTLSIDPDATKRFAGHVLSVLLVYVAVRNWLGSRDAFCRLAWICTINGVALSVFSLGQFLSSTATSRNLIYWRFPTDANVYGPFVCRNHYTDYIAMCGGMAISLILIRGKDGDKTTPAETDMWGRAQHFLSTPGHLVSDPHQLFPILAFGLILVSIPFSLSRGGLLALVIGGLISWLLTVRFIRAQPGQYNTETSHRQTQWGLILAVAVGLILLAWFGGEKIEKRWNTSSSNTDTRTEIWLTGLSSLPGFWLAGSGGGTFMYVEPLSRTTQDPSKLHDHAHNEFVEAVVEGGSGRLLLTLVIAGALLMRVGRAYRSRKDRMSRSLLLGSWFGIAVVVLHAWVDFGIHMPAVACLVSIIAGFSMAEAEDDTVVSSGRRSRRRFRVSHSDDTSAGMQVSGGTQRSGNMKDIDEALVSYDIPQGETSAKSISQASPIKSGRRSDSATSWSSSDRHGVIRGRAALIGLAVAWLISLVLLLDARNRQSANWYQRQANVISSGNQPEKNLSAIPYLEACTHVRPSDPAGFVNLARAHLAAANESTLYTNSALFGTVSTYELSANRYPQAVIKSHIIPALQALRSARDLCPAYPEAQAPLGLYARYFKKAEPQFVYLERGLRLLPSDAALWTMTGSEAWAAGDQNRALACWKRALAISHFQVGPVLRAVRATRQTPAQFDVILTKILPTNDPQVLLEAVNTIFPNPRTQAAQRRSLLQQAVEAQNQPSLTFDQLLAVARACRELERSNTSEAYQKAINEAPQRSDVRDEFARWLSDEERYEKALTELEWLLNNHPNRRSELQDRIVTAKHGIKLAREIAAPPLP